KSPVRWRASSNRARCCCSKTCAFTPRRKPTIRCSQNRWLRWPRSTSTTPSARRTAPMLRRRASHTTSSLPSGLLMEKEITYLGKALESPEHPFVAILGGSKISGKIDVIQNLLDKVDTLVIVGGMAYTFYRALGVATGKSLVEEDKIELAKATLAKAKAKGVNLLLPVDNILADSFANDAKAQVWDSSKNFPDDWQGLDIGPKSAAAIEQVVSTAKTIVWNGPAGVFEFPRFAVGTNAI